jgi:4-aminobutyrate aminotransferase-like enzyme
MNVREKDRAFLVRTSSVENLQIVRSNGSLLFDERGRKYIDFITGWNVGNFCNRLQELNRPATVVFKTKG